MEMTPQGNDEQNTSRNNYFEKSLADTPTAILPSCHVGLVFFLRTHRPGFIRVGDSFILKKGTRKKPPCRTSPKL
jgi:hypothetical protein